MRRRNPQIPENIIKRYRGVKTLAKAPSAAEGERAAARVALAQLEERYPGIEEAAAAPPPPPTAPAEPAEPRGRPPRPEDAPREAKEMYQPERVRWLTLIPGLPFGQAIGFLGIREDGMIDVFTKNIYTASTPALDLGVHLLYKFIRAQPREAEKVASKHFVIVGRERTGNFKFIPFLKLAAMVGYNPSGGSPHAPFSEDIMDPDDFE